MINDYSDLLDRREEFGLVFQLSDSRRSRNRAQREIVPRRMAPCSVAPRRSLDTQNANDKACCMSSSAVRNVIALASELSDDERRVVIDAIAPKESIASLAEEWEAEIARRAARVRAGQSQGKPAEQVFGRLESKLKGQ